MKINNKTIQASVSAEIFRSSIDLFALEETLYKKLSIVQALEDGVNKAQVD